ncbi:MAG TPA: leucine-rich repeat domain-containing protein [Rhabdochlamydiaceae bacterium]
MSSVSSHSCSSPVSACGTSRFSSSSFLGRCNWATYEDIPAHLLGQIFAFDGNPNKTKLINRESYIGSSLSNASIIKGYSQDCRLSELRVLRLSHMHLTEVPRGLKSLTKLCVLSLSENRISRLPEQRAFPKSLRELRLHSNRIRFLPSWIGQLTQLTQLSISYNSLHSLPNEIGNLHRLEVLAAHQNWLSKLPPGFVNLTALKWVYLSHNNFRSIPPELGSLALKKLEFGKGNPLAALPPQEALLVNIPYIARNPDHIRAKL